MPRRRTRTKNKVPPLTLTPLINIPLIRQGDPLADILVKSISDTDLEPQDGDILVVAQKIVSKAEGRMVNLAEVTPRRARSNSRAKPRKTRAWSN